MPLKENCVVRGLIKLLPQHQVEVKQICEEYYVRKPQGEDYVLERLALLGVQREGLIDLNWDESLVIPPGSHDLEISLFDGEGSVRKPVIISINNWIGDSKVGHTEVFLPEEKSPCRADWFSQLLLEAGGMVFFPTRTEGSEKRF